MYKNLIYYLLLGCAPLILSSQSPLGSLPFDRQAAPWVLVDVIDYDGDGHNDLITQHKDSTVFLHRNTGNNQTEQAKMILGHHVYYESLDWHDDGDADLLALDINTNVVGIYLNDSLGLNWWQNLASEFGHAVYGDMDGDGDKDILFDTYFSIYTNVFCCEAPFLQCVQVDNTIRSTFCGGDVNGDGQGDYALSANNQNYFYIYVNVGFGNFAKYEILADFPPLWYLLDKGVCLHDIDGDGDQDYYYWSVELRRIVWRAQLTSPWQLGPVETVVDDPELTDSLLVIRPGDCDGDGDAELAVLTDDQVLLFHNNDTLGFSEEILLPQTDAKNIFFKDFDSDGALDLIIGLPSEVQVLYNTGNCQFSAPQAVGTLEEQKNSPDFQIAPNPTYGNVVFSWKEKLPKNARLTITDLSGKKLKQIEIPDGSMQLEARLTELPDGVYFVRFEVEGKQLGTVKVVRTK